MGLDEARRGGHRFEVFEDRIESFDVAHLEQGAVLLGKLDQVRRLSGVVGHGLFEEQMPASLEQQTGQFIMGRRRRHDAQGIAFGRCFRNGSERPHAIFIGDLPRGLRGQVINAGELDEPRGRKFGVNAGMFLAQRTGAEHSDFDSGTGRCLRVVRRYHGASLPLSTHDWQLTTVHPVAVSERGMYRAGCRPSWG